MKSSDSAWANLAQVPYAVSHHPIMWHGTRTQTKKKGELTN